MKNASRYAIKNEDIDALWMIYHPENSIVAVGQSNNGKSTNLNDEIDIDSVETLALYTRYLLDAQQKTQNQ